MMEIVRSGARFGEGDGGRDEGIGLALLVGLYILDTQDHLSHC